MTSFLVDVKATHIIGGELTYVHVQGDEHLVSLRIYRDCGPTNTNGTGFDLNVEIGVFDASGNYLFSEFFDYVNAVNVPVQLNNPCLTAPPSICVESSTYSDTISLPPIPGGYILAYQRCCRTPSTLNLQAPSTQGLTCTVEVPDLALGNNSTPTFTAYPPIALCANEAMVFDHSATDPDGDVLVYELCPPLAGGAQGNPVPSPPAGPPYAPVTWGGGYSTAYMMDANPILAIDAATGSLTVTPTVMGSYAIGVCVKEYRNGVLLSTVRRDLRFDVVPCLVQVASSVQQQVSLCDGLTVSMDNLSQNSSSFFWDFGDPGTTTDTSSLFAPTYTYADTGVYQVMLIAEPGWVCADTSYATFQVYLPLDPGFIAPPIQCADALPVQLEAVGNFGPNATVEWDMGPFGDPPLMNGHQVDADWTQPGWHAVQVQVSEHGCTDTFTDTVVVYPNPTVDLTTNTAGCAPLGISPVPVTTAWTPLQFLWDLGDGTSSTDSLPTHTYVDPGTYTVSLTVYTNSGCVDTAMVTYVDLMSAFAPPTAAFTVTPPTVNVFDPLVLVTDNSIDASSWTYYVDGTTYTTPDFAHSFSDGGVYTVTQIVESGLNCLDTAQAQVVVEDVLLYVPNAFSPDGDGKNDLFLPKAFGALNARLTIYDRWGQEIHTTDDLKEGWDGGGMPVGVYVYRISYSLVGPGRRERLGSVTLVR